MSLQLFDDRADKAHGRRVRVQLAGFKLRNFRGQHHGLALRPIQLRYLSSNGSGRPGKNSAEMMEKILSSCLSSEVLPMPCATVSTWLPVFASTKPIAIKRKCQ